MNEHFVIHKGSVVAHPLTKRQRFIRRAALVALASIAAIGSMLSASPGVAHADANSYLKKLAEAGYYGNNSKWHELGWAVCRAQSAGVPDFDIAQVLASSSMPGVYLAEGYEIIQIANDELCPTVRGSSTFKA